MIAALITAEAVLFAATLIYGYRFRRDIEALRRVYERKASFACGSIDNRLVEP